MKIGETDRFRLEYSSCLHRRIEYVNGFELIDRRRPNNDPIALHPLMLTDEEDKEFLITRQSIIGTLKNKGYKIITRQEVEIIYKQIYERSVKDSDYRVLICDDVNAGMFYGFVPGRECLASSYWYEDRTFLRRLFEEQYLVKREEQIALVCIKNTKPLIRKCRRAR